MSRAYYNEIEPYAADWLENLIRARHLPAGDVDRRSIADVRPDDLRGYTQCHFFAGIGGWAYAARLAGWPDGRPLWTGSCPCQPFSAAGKRQGEKDPRHLWPEFRRLIAECNPAIVFGEQVASKDGRLWLAGVRVDLEELGYAVGAADLCAAGIGAPHIRARLWWVANANGAGERREHHSESRSPRESKGEVGRAHWERFRVVTGRGVGWDSGQHRRRAPEPYALVLADGFPGRVAQVGAFGNAIVPQVAVEFMTAYMEARAA